MPGEQKRQNVSNMEKKPAKCRTTLAKVFLQKLEYIHDNPVRANLCLHPEEYLYSSAVFYERSVDQFKMLTHYIG